MKHYHDWGRVVVGSKKDFYKLKNGTFKVYLSKLWPRKSIQHQDRYTRYLIEQLRSNLKPILLTEDKQEVEEFIDQILLLKERFAKIEDEEDSADLAFKVIHDFEHQRDFYGNPVFNHELLLQDSRIDYSQFNKEAFLSSHYGLSPDEIASEKAHERVWLLHADQVRFNCNYNQLEIEIPFIGEIIPIDVANFDWSDQDIESDFLVEINKSDGTREVTELNASSYSYHLRFDEVYQEELAKLQPSLKKSNRKIKTDFSENPGVCNKNHLHSLSVDEEEFQKTFGISGQFGNYLSNKDRKFTLEKTSNALLNLCQAMGCLPEDLALQIDATPLAICFASRGSGRAAGHYEEAEYCINFTRSTLLSNNGIMAHEFGHALDHFLNWKLGNGDSGFLSEQPTERMPEAFARIIDYLNDPTTQFSKNRAALDCYQGRRKPYFSTIKEKFATAFSSCIIQILDQMGIRDDYLAFNYNTEVRIGGNTVSANPEDEDLSALSVLFQDLFAYLIDQEVFHRLEDSRDLIVKRTMPSGRGWHGNGQKLSGRQVAFI